ncbi:MAG: hypothetical protein AAFR42_16505 [Cyanobacteria bacterium J06628_6]
MSAQEHMRLRMTQHRHMARNRQQTLLSRAAAAVGMMPSEVSHGTRIQGKLTGSAQGIYDRSRSAMS